MDQRKKYPGKEPSREAQPAQQASISELESLPDTAGILRIADERRYGGSLVRFYAPEEGSPDLT